MEQEKAFIGVDVGSKGVIAVQYGSTKEFYYISSMDCYTLADTFAEIRAKHENISCVIEDVHALFNSAAKATFSFGENKGMLIGLLCANKIPFVLVQPKEWQKELWINADYVFDYKQVKNRRTGEMENKKVVNTKKTSINAAKRLFPSLDLRKSTKCKNIDDNKVDALLMSEYARRKNL